MPPVEVSQQAEADFMQSLLSGLDNTFSSNSPTKTPVKSKKTARVERVIEKIKSPNKIPRETKISDTLPTITTTTHATADDDAYMTALLQGAEDWDWGDMNDFMTPKKAASPKKRGLGSPRKPLPQVPKREYQRDACTRCFVESISDMWMAGRPQKASSRLLPITLNSYEFWFLDVGCQGRSR